MRFVGYRSFAVVAALAAGLPGAAAAGTPKAVAPSTVSGVVIARQPARGTLVVASRGGAVETLRTSARRPVGTRVVAKATRLADGTYRAGAVSGRRVVRSARVRGVVVRVLPARLLLSAGGSVFPIGRGRGLSSAVVHSSVQPGTVVNATVAIDPADGSVSQSSVKQVGQTSLVSLEGTISSLSPGTLAIAVDEGALTTVSVPASLSLPATIATGDRVELLAQFAAGAFTLVTIQDDHAAAQSGSGASAAAAPRADVEAEGPVTAVSATSLTVQGEHASPITFVVPAGIDVSAVQTGMRVHARGSVGSDGSITLVKLELQNAQDGQDANGQDAKGGQSSGSSEGEAARSEIEAEGVVTALASDSITIQPHGAGAPVTFAVPAGFDLSSAAVGDSVHAKGTASAGGSPTLVRLEVQGAGDGQSNAGSSSGDRSSGDQSSGTQSSADQSSGSQSSGDQSSGDQSSGDQSSGDQSSGSQSTADQSGGGQSGADQSNGGDD